MRVDNLFDSEQLNLIEVYPFSELNSEPTSVPEHTPVDESSAH